MANPSLQIGNGKFAIKENDLLGYSSSGTRFFPIPITMTRATLGSRVNPSGLIEDVELLGSELIQDSDFLLTGTQAENVTGTYWTTGAGWSISGGKATLVAQAGSSSLGSVVMSVTPGKTYKVTVNVSATSTGFRLYDTAGVVSYGLQLGENVFYTIPSSSSYQITPLGLAGASGIIDNISVKEATIDGLARVDYTDGTGSLLVEPQRTNLILYSQDISNAAWTKSSGGTGSTPVVTANYTASPLEGEMADRVIFNLNGGTASADLSTLQSSGFNLTMGDDVTYYMAVKTNDGSTVNMTLNNNLGLSEVKSITPEWTIIKTSTTVTSTSSGVLRLRLRGSEAVSDYADVSVSYAQLEVGSYPTSYIKTQGSSVTRNADLYTKTGISDKINSEEGVLFLEVAALSDDGTNRYISINDGTTSNYIYFRFMSTSNRVLTRTVVAGVTINTLQITISDTTAFNKFAFKWKSGDYAFWINGVEELVEASATIFGANVLNKIEFSFPTDGGGGFPSKVKQLQIFETALTDSELATLTTI